MDFYSLLMLNKVETTIDVIDKVMSPPQLNTRRQLLCYLVSGVKIVHNYDRIGEVYRKYCDSTSFKCHMMDFITTIKV